jgi:hypothetical protein
VVQQPASDEQVVPHPVPEHAYGQQEAVGGTVQIPEPLHRACGFKVVPVQDCALQTVDTDHLRQAPEPLHEPSAPHVVGSDWMQSFFGSVPAPAEAQAPLPLQVPQTPHSPSGSPPDVWNEQTPTLPGRPQVRQVPVHALLQQ